MAKYWRYLSYVVRHKVYVFRAACALGVPWLGLLHDLSKFRLDELVPYAEKFYGGPHAESYVQICNGLKSKWQVQASFDRAWLAHIHRNKHHPQHWVLREDSGTVKVLEMPDRYRREMLADWVGAGRAQGKPNTAAWYLDNYDRIQLGLQTRAWVDRMLGVTILPGKDGEGVRVESPAWSGRWSRRLV